MFPRTKITAMFVPDPLRTSAVVVYPCRRSLKEFVVTHSYPAALACRHLRRYRAPIMKSPPEIESRSGFLRFRFVQ